MYRKKCNSPVFLWRNLSNKNTAFPCTCMCRFISCLQTLMLMVEGLSFECRCGANANRCARPYRPSRLSSFVKVPPNIDFYLSRNWGGLSATTLHCPPRCPPLTIVRTSMGACNCLSCIKTDSCLTNHLPS